MLFQEEENEEEPRSPDTEKMKPVTIKQEKIEEDETGKRVDYFSSVVRPLDKETQPFSDLHDGQKKERGCIYLAKLLLKP